MSTVARQEEDGADQRLRGGGAGGQVRRRRRHHGLSDPSLHRDDDGAGADGGQRRARCRVHRGRQRALAAEHRARRLLVGRAGVHRQLGRRRAVRLRAVLADLRQPHAGADDDRRPDAGPARRLRIGAHRRAVDARHGLAHGLVVPGAGSVRQSSVGLSDWRRSARAAAADGLSGWVLRLAHHDGRGAAGSRTGQGVPAAVQASVSARSAASRLARAADHARAGPAAAARTGPRHGRRLSGDRAGARGVRRDFRPPVRSVGRRVHDRRRRRGVLHAGRTRRDGPTCRSGTCASAAPRSAWCACARSDPTPPNA